MLLNNPLTQGVLSRPCLGGEGCGGVPVLSARLRLPLLVLGGRVITVLRLKGQKGRGRRGSQVRHRLRSYSSCGGG